jgi:hypothetical protein
MLDNNTSQEITGADSTVAGAAQRVIKIKDIINS